MPDVEHTHRINARNNLMASVGICRVILQDDGRTTLLSNTEQILGVLADRGKLFLRKSTPAAVRAYVEEVFALKAEMGRCLRKRKTTPWQEVFPANRVRAPFRGWEGFPRGRWEVHGSEAGTKKGGAGKEFYFVSSREIVPPGHDFRIEYMARTDEDPTDLSLVIGGKTSAWRQGVYDRRPDLNGYCFAFGAISNRTTELQRRLLTIASTESTAIKRGHDHHCVAERIGGALSFWVDGVKAYSVIDAVPYMGKGHGYVGFYTYGPNHRFFDLKVHVRPTGLEAQTLERIEALRMVILDTPDAPSKHVEAYYLGGNNFIFKDVTEVVVERKKMEAERRQAEKMEAFLRLASGAAHEMNQPLTVILGQVDLLTEALPARLPKGMGQNLRDLKESSRRLAGIVNKIGNIRDYKTKHYIGDSEILDIDASSRSS